MGERAGAGRTTSSELPALLILLHAIAGEALTSTFTSARSRHGPPTRATSVIRWYAWSPRSRMSPTRRPRSRVDGGSTACSLVLHGSQDAFRHSLGNWWRSARPRGSFDE